MRVRSLVMIISLIAQWSAAAALQAAPRQNTYAVIVGHNRGGPGQKDLRYAQQDARRMMRVLTELGGFSHDSVQLVLDSGRGDLLRALSRVSERLAAHARRGEPSMFLFYYSGHARASALNMGAEELALTRLRRRLLELPSTVTIAILDACQTGAISRIKGASPAADFSYNSVNRLNAAGVVVMASSSATELSQEAAALQSSYFTHHLVVGLRGAADTNSDGRITLSEAYRYAYDRTLISTASTAVGKQHVTLETRLRGKGEMVLTYPARASSRLELPSRLKGQVLVHRRPGHSVVAELSKSAGGRVKLALPDGRYVAFVRQDRRTLRCELTLRPGRVEVLRAGSCQAVQAAAARAKGPGQWRETWGVEVGGGFLFSRSDGYDSQLENFGYDRQSGLIDVGEKLSLAAAISYRFSVHFSLVLGYSMLDRAEYSRQVWDLEGKSKRQGFEWSSHGLGAYFRGTLPLFQGRLNPFVQAGGGLTWGTTTYRDTVQASEEIDDELHWGYHLAAAAGASLMPWRNFGFFGQLSYTYAPTLENLVGDTHDSGGPGLFLGLRGAL